MIWRLINIVTGNKEESSGSGKKRKTPVEKFSLEFCKIDARIPPDFACFIQHISDEELIFKSSADLAEGAQSPFKITYYPLKGQFEDFESFETPIRVARKGKIADDSYLYKSHYVNINDAGLKAFFKYLRNIEALQLHQKVDYKDRRTHFRVNRVLPVFSKHLNKHKGLTRNISCGGLMLSCGGGVKKGDTINFRLELDDFSVDAMQLNGEVCWVDERDPNQVLIGIRFIDLSEDEARILKNYVDSIKRRMDDD